MKIFDTNYLSMFHIAIRHQIVSRKYNDFFSFFSVFVVVAEHRFPWM